MMRGRSGDAADLFAADMRARIELAPGAVVLKGFALPYEQKLLEAIDAIVVRSPFRHMMTPGGKVMSVAMTNCGRAGWVTDRKGYRYETVDPETGKPWPAMPKVFLEVARAAAAGAAFEDFLPDACLINRYAPGARMSLHQDRDEQDFGAPIVSVSLGLTAKFLFGGLARSDKPQRIALEHGDAVVWGGPARLAFHGIDALKDGEHPVTGRGRINLTFRKAL